MSKTTISENRKICSDVRAAEAALKVICDDAPKREAIAVLAISNMRKAMVEKLLRETDVEQLNYEKSGIRVSKLRYAGFDNIWSVIEAPLKKIIDIDGIGEAGAALIKKTAAEIAEGSERTVNLRLDPDARSGPSDKLVQSLYVIINTRQSARKAEEIYKRAYPAIEANLTAAKPICNAVAKLFASKKKREASQRAVDNLKKWLESADAKAAKELESGYLNTIRTAYYDRCWKDFAENSARYYVLLEKLSPETNTTVVGNYGLPEVLTREINAVELDLSGMKSYLRLYQDFGVRYILNRKAVLLGDEMGLGKTVQAIAAMVSLKAAGGTHFMVVCPAGVLINWCREIKKHSTTLEPVKIKGDDREALEIWLKDGGVAVTTFESISKFELPEGTSYSMLVVDEAHYVKNPEAQRTKALLRLREMTERVLYMTGTPLENRVEEMCFLVGCLQPMLATELEKVKYLEKSDEFRQKLAPVYLRRTREDVLKELPELIENEEWCEMTPEDNEEYSIAAGKRQFMSMRRVSWSNPDVLTSSKALRLLEICKTAEAEDRKIIVFSFFKETIDAVQRLIGDKCIGPIDGGVTPEKRQMLVDEFTKAPGGTVLTSQIGAGGTGLNIQTASVVVLCEPQLKPSIENQAISRAYRMGQVRNVLVYRLLCEDSIDERITDILKKKQDAFEKFAEDSVSGEECLRYIEQEEAENAA